MANYIIIGGDQKEYGPVSEADVRQWIAEGRLSAESRVKAESDAEFRALALFPEFATAFSPQTAPAAISPLAQTSGDFLERDYELDLGGCFSRGWDLVKDNLGVLFVCTLIYSLIQMTVSVMGNIPLIGLFITLANFICTGPLIGGLYYVFIRVNRGESVQIGEMFSGFSLCFIQLFLGVLVPTLVLGVCMLPFIIVLLVKLAPVFSQLPQLQHMTPGEMPNMELINALKSAMFSSLPIALICAIPVTYLSVCWKFTVPLIIDRQMDFASAMRASWKMVNKHWWMVFGLVILISLLNLAGILACCIGVLISFPIGIAALMIAYETIFSIRKN